MMKIRLLLVLTATASFLLPAEAKALVLFDTINNPTGSFSATNGYGRKAAQHFTTGGAVIVLQEYSARFSAWKHGPLKFSIVEGGTTHPDGSQIAVLYEGGSEGLSIVDGIVTISGLGVTLFPGRDYWLVLTNTFLGPQSQAGGFDLFGSHQNGSTNGGEGVSLKSAYWNPSTVKWNEGSESPILMKLDVGLPDGVEIKVTGLHAQRQAEAMSVSLVVVASGGVVPVAALPVLWAADPAGPCYDAGTIAGDGTTFTGNIDLPDGPGGEPQCMAFLKAEVP